MVDLQRDIAKEGNYILDGRDAGSVVFPNADYKFYLEASLEERAKRRYKEELSKEVDISFETVKESIKKEINTTVIEKIVLWLCLKTLL